MQRIDVNKDGTLQYIRGPVIFPREFRVGDYNNIPAVALGLYPLCKVQYTTEDGLRVELSPSRGSQSIIVPGSDGLNRNIQPFSGIVCPESSLLVPGTWDQFIHYQGVRNLMRCFGKNSRYFKEFKNFFDRLKILALNALRDAEVNEEEGYQFIYAIHAEDTLNPFRTRYYSHQLDSTLWACLRANGYKYESIMGQRSGSIIPIWKRNQEEVN